MIYISIDTETGGLDWDNHSLLEFGAIIEDTKKQLSFDEIPKFSVLLEHPGDKYVGSSFALAMHHEIFKELSSPPNKRTMNVIPFNKLGLMFYSWLKENSKYDFSKTGPVKIVVAGKNFGTFDKRFLDNNPDFNKYIRIDSRIVDPAILYYNDEVDENLPNLSECKKRAGLSKITVDHRAINDAWDVIEVLRGKMYPKI